LAYCYKLKQQDADAEQEAASISFGQRFSPSFADCFTVAEKTEHST
jgi:hypothetical protein